MRIVCRIMVILTNEKRKRCHILVYIMSASHAKLPFLLSQETLWSSQEKYLVILIVILNDY